MSKVVELPMGRNQMFESTVEEGWSGVMPTCASVNGMSLVAVMVARTYPKRASFTRCGFTAETSFSVAIS